MKKRAYIGLVFMSLFVSLAAANTVAAQSNQLRIEIPFDFYVGKTQVPAGEYIVTPMTSDGAALRIRSRDGHENVVFLTNSVQESTRRPGPARLVFNKYYDQHFLSAVWEGSMDGRELAASKRERNLRKELRIAKNATNAPDFGIVTVVARLDKR